MRKWLFLLRALFPSWRLFDDVGNDIELWVRDQRDGPSWSEWRPALPPIPRGFSAFPLNPRGNLLHAGYNGVEHLLQDLSGEPSDVASLLSYDLVQRTVRFYLEGRPRKFQFKITADRSDVLISAEIEA